MNEYGIVPPTGAFDKDWFQNFTLQHGKQGSLSSAGWTNGNEGFPQQTFLGASIRSFTINAGFGDTSSTMSAELVDDEYNKSDEIGYGDGDDAYHNGEYDLFRPPAVGSPVWFKFGKNPATVEQAWRRTFDEIYGYNTLGEKPFNVYTAESKDFNLPQYHFVDLENSTQDIYTVVDKTPLWDKSTKWRGKDHIVFGGVLQGYSENDSSQGKSLYTANVTDPREILSNCSMILGNYQGTTYNNKNLFNVYGFLEYDPSQDLQDFFGKNAAPSVLTKNISPNGTVFYSGNDTWTTGGAGGLPDIFPITGQGFSRRSDQGVPFYRIVQALTAMFEYNGLLPEEYVAAGLGGRVNFRGFNYVVDFTGLPIDLIPPMYFMDFDQLDFLSFAQEVCDIISHELFVQLLPVIDHPACEFLESQNKAKAKAGKFDEIISGIIRIDAIDKSKQPRYGAILEYLQEVSDRGIDVLNKDVGFELSNVTTDKFVVGAQEVEMYFFHTNNDRDELHVNRGSAGQSAIDSLRAEQWLIETSLKQQVLPYYGLLGEKAVSIPRGWGSYQQILLDARNLNAFGVGNYYVATELELRAALVSFERWKNFLLKYNETYIQDIAEYGAVLSALTSEAGYNKDQALKELVKELKGTTELGPQFLEQFEGRTFAVTVPRSVWDSDRPYMGEDGLPASPCSPPFGYPLYYKRATKIGIPEAGVIKVINAKSKVVTNINEINERLDSKAESGNTPYGASRQKLNLLLEKKKVIEQNTRVTLPSDKQYFEALDDNQEYQNLLAKIVQAEVLVEELERVKANLKEQGQKLVADTLNDLEGLAENPMIANLPQIAKQHLENAKKVYQFVKRVAEQSLGKQFLVKIPKACNVRYQPQIKTYGSRGANIAAGPFGFPPLPVDDNFQNPKFVKDIKSAEAAVSSRNWFLHYTNVDILTFDGDEASLGTATNEDNPYRNGALRCNYNPINDKWNFNYKPEPQGGYFNYSIFQTNVSPSEKAGLKKGAVPMAGRQSLCPIDIKNFLSDNGRVQCYAKYDNSHVLNFANIPAQDMTQQSLDAASNSWTPDIVQALPNVRADQLNLFKFDTLQEEMDKNAKNIKQAPSVAFVKCDVDEKLYMPPKLEQRSVAIYGRKYTAYLSNLDFDLVKTTDGDGCPDYELKVQDLDPVFGLPDDGGVDGTRAAYIGFVRDEFKFYSNPKLKEYIINTDIQNLDSNHVYALVTVPGRIQSTIDQRYADGPMQVNNTVTIKQLMTQDVVKIPEFSVPAFPEKDFPDINCEELKDFNPSLKELNEVDRIQRQAMKGIKFNQGEVGLEFIQPSPIYPSMIAIPLMSWERCYGPWLSSAELDETRLRYNNLGGKIEFVKDENLAPWNYGGYQLLNEAGLLQAQFSNSLMLINERGGFVLPEVPTGISLAGALKQSGPLVTSISANISNNQLQTTVKLDLYTASYGKLQKQKEGAIAQVTRERQKMIDRNNNAIRRGMGKSQTSTDPVSQLMANGGATLINRAKDAETFIEEEQKAPRRTTMLVNDGQSRVAGERLVNMGIEAYNTLAQKAAQFGVTPDAVDLGSIFQIVQPDVTESKDVPSRQNLVSDTVESIARRFFGNPNQGDEEL